MLIPFQLQIRRNEMESLKVILSLLRNAGANPKSGVRGETTIMQYCTSLVLSNELIKVELSPRKI